MRFSKVSIRAAAYELPQNELSSVELEERLQTAFERLRVPAGRLEGLTGVKSRRVWTEGERTSDVASLAGAKLLDGLGDFDRRKIDVLIHTGVCRDYVEPATASVIHHQLGLDPHCMVFDLSNACVGFLNGLLVAANMVESGQSRWALVVTGENSGPIYGPSVQALCEDPTEQRFRNSIASLTLGSGAVAYLVGPTDEEQGGARICGGIYQADSRSYDLCKGFGSYQEGFRMETNTHLLMKNGLMLSKLSFEIFKRELEWRVDDISHYITHQISGAHHAKIFEVLDIDPEKGYSDISWLGNTGSAAVPLSMLLRRDEKAFSSGDKVALLGIGSGLNCVMIGIEWS